MSEKMSKVIELINDIRDAKGEAPLTDVTEATSLRNDVGMDSIDLAEFTARLDAPYSVDIFAQGIVDSVGEVLERLQ